MKNSLCRTGLVRLSTMMVWLLVPVAGEAAESELRLSCDDTAITVACDDTASCTTVRASNPAWNVTCKGSGLGNNKVRTICSNATDIGGTHVQADIKVTEFDEGISEAVGTATGSTCSIVN